MAKLGNQEALWEAVADALRPVVHLETEWQASKLEKRICDYIRKSTKGLDFHGQPWYDSILDCAMCFYGSIFQALGDRAWMDQVDFVFALDLCITENFPASVFAGVDRDVIERAILAHHDEAFEEQRYLPRLWVLIDRYVDGWARKRAYEAASAGRKLAIRRSRGEDGAQGVKQFVSRWIDATVQHMSRTTQGAPGDVLPQDVAPRFFRSLLDEAHAMPLYIHARYGSPPKDWPFISYAVRVAYCAYDTTKEDATRPARKRPRVGTKEAEKDDEIAGLVVVKRDSESEPRVECKLEVEDAEDAFVGTEEAADDVYAQVVEPPD